MGRIFKLYCVFLLIVIVHTVVFPESTKHGKEKYYRMNNSNQKNWKSYVISIDEATKNFNKCTEDCYKEQRKNDFRFWIENGGIKETDFLHAKKRKLGEHYQIINHTLYRQPNCIFPARCSGNEHFILKIIDQLPDMELIINSHDWPKVRSIDTPSPVFSFSKTKEELDIMYPAWTFWEGGPAVWPIYPKGIGRWDLMRKTMNKSALKWPWEKKTKKAFFRGSRTSPERDPLVLLSWYEPSKADAHYTKNQAYKGKEDTLGMPPAEEVPLDEHCNHRYLFNFRGVAASFRLKFLFLCRSLVFHVGDEWMEFFYHALKPWVHYIPVSTALVESKDLIEFARENDALVQRIADRGHKFIRNHLRMEDIENYWFKILIRYTKLMKWKPKRDRSLIEIKKQN